MEMDPEKTALFVRLPTPVAARLDTWAKASGRSKQDLVAEMIETTDGRTEGPATTAGVDDVLDLAAVATLLRVEPDDVLARIGDGDFPARRFGDAWRFSRAAVATWLAGTDPLSDRRTGFSGTPAG